MRAQRGAGCIAEREIYRSASIDKGVVNDENAKALTGFTRTKVEHAITCRVISPFLCRSIAGGATETSPSLLRVIVAKPAPSLTL